MILLFWIWNKDKKQEQHLMTFDIDTDTIQLESSYWMEKKRAPKYNTIQYLI